MPHLEIIPVPVAGEVAEQTDIAALVLSSIANAGLSLTDGDVVCIASKIVAKAEGAWIDLELPKADLPADPADLVDPAEVQEALRQARRDAARQRAARIVADTPFVLITQTHHGYVCANGGIDASNVPDDRGLDLPHDCDRSASDIRAALSQVLTDDASLGVVITDTFGRPWREGQVDVALGVAGIGAVRDERGTSDRLGKPLEVTVVAVADQIAAAADLARSKADGTPVVIIRGLGSSVAGDGSGADLVRDAATDLFRWGGPTAIEQGVAARRTVRSFTSDPVDANALARGVEAATTAPAPHHTRPWRFVRLLPETRESLLDAMAEQWRDDLTADGLPQERIDARVQRSDAILRTAPELLVPFVVMEGSHEYPDPARSSAERDMFLLAGGAGLANFQVVLAAHGLGTAWISSALFCAPVVRRLLDLDEDWHPLGMIAVGHRAGPPPDARPHREVKDVLFDR